MRRFFGTVNLMLLVWMAGFALWAWNVMPDQIPLHFGVDGEATRWGEKTLVSWFGLPAFAGGMYLLMELFRALLPSHPNWVNLPDRTKVTDLPRETQEEVLEFLSGFLALVQTELLLIFSLIVYASYRTAMGNGSQGIMILVLLLALLASPFLMVVFFLRLQSAMERGKEAARQGASMAEGRVAP